MDAGLTRVKTNGIELAARVWPGSGSTVVGVHGLTANHACWYPLADTVSPAHRFVAYDLRGRGDSDKPANGYDLETHGRDLLGLLDHFGVGRAIVIGHSLGAGIAVRCAAHHPERVDRVVLVDGGFDPRAEVFDSIAPAVGRLRVEFPSLDAFLGMRVQAPTLVFRAPDGLLRADDCLMTEDEAAALVRAIPRCRLVVVPGTNHYTVLIGDQPVVRTELGAFLAASSGV